MKSVLGCGARWLDCGGRATGKARKDPYPIGRTMHELGWLGMGTGLDAPDEGRRGLLLRDRKTGKTQMSFQLGGAVSASESVCKRRE